MVTLSDINHTMQKTADGKNNIRKWIFFNEGESHQEKRDAVFFPEQTVRSINVIKTMFRRTRTTKFSSTM